MLKQKFIIDFGAKLASYFITAITGILVARLAGPKIIGTIAYATAYVTTFSFITGIFGSAHIKLVSEGQNEENCNKTYLVLMFFAMLLFFTIVSIFFIIQKHLFDYKFELHETEIVILLTLFAFLVNLIFMINETFYIAKIKQVRSNLPALFRNIIYNILRIIVVVLGMGAIALASVNLISAIVLLPLAVYFIKQLKFGNLNKDLLKKYLMMSLPLLSMEITTIVMIYSDKLILEYYSTIQQVGYYSAAFSIGGMLLLFGNTAGTLFFPLFSKFINQNNFEAIRSIIQIFERFIFVFLFPTIMLLTLYAYPVIIFLLGKQYEPSVTLFSILVFSSFFIIWSMPYGNVLTGMGLFWLTSMINFFKFILFVLVMIILISPSILNLGAMALAITALVTNIFMFLMYYYFTFKKTKIFLFRSILRYIIFWFVLSPIFYIIYNEYLYSLSVPVQLLLLIPLTFVLIYKLYFLFGLVNKNDITILKQSINLNSASLYIRNEFKGNPYQDPPDTF